jgi:TolB-like protein/Flp pilus assembly protein TadD
MKDSPPVSSPGPSDGSAEAPLDSWKEIAAHVKRDVSTVQRWERREGMPVHRHVHDKRGSVYAFSSELDAWLQSRKLRLEEEEEGDKAETAVDAESGDGPKGIPRVGLRLVLAGMAVLALLSVTYVLIRSRTVNSRRAKISSLAVLPLQNLSGDPSQEYFADGMTEELIGRLSRIRGLRVISRTSAMHFKNTQLSAPEIAKMLGVDAIVEGSIVREGREVRVHAQLIRAATDEHIWAEEYQREYGSLLEVEEEVSRSIAEQIEVNLTPEDRARLVPTRPVDPEAHENYLKGLYYFNQRTEGALNKSIASFQQAISRDSGYALAYSGLADAYAMLGFRGGFPSKDALSRAKTAAQKAIELDHTLAEPHASLAFIAETHEWDWATAEREYKRALELKPGDARTHNWYAGYLTYVGRFDDGISEAKRARDLDPLSLPINNALAGRLLASSRYNEALRQVQETLQLDSHFAPAHQTLGWVYLHSGKQEEAIREFQNALQLSGTEDNDLQLDLGFAYAVTGKQDEARRILAKLEKLHQQGVVPSGSVAILHGALGEANDAFAWLEKAYEERDPQLTYIKAGRRFAPLRKDPRFEKLVHRIGLPD